MRYFNYEPFCMSMSGTDRSNIIMSFNNKVEWRESNSSDTIVNSCLGHAIVLIKWREKKPDCRNSSKFQPQNVDRSNIDTQTHDGSFDHVLYKHLYYSIPKHMTAHLSMLCTNTSITRYPNTWRLISPCFVQTTLLLDTQTHEGSFVHAVYKHLYYSIPKHMTAHLSMLCTNTSITRYPNTWRLICPCFVQTPL